MVMKVKVELNSIVLFVLVLVLASCSGQTLESKVDDETRVESSPVVKLDDNIMVIFQDSKDVYWFGSWKTGVYRYDGEELVNYTVADGLLNNRVDEIKEDAFGNIYFASANTTSKVSKFDGETFTTLKAVPGDNWGLDSTDMWLRYSYGNTGRVYRYDGTTLFELDLPNPPNLTNPFDVYSIYKDRMGNIWFGTNPVGVCRYDGESFDWITEEDVTEFRNEGANGVRSIAEDKHGDFWFNTEFRYSIYDSITLKSDAFYTRHQSIGGLDGKQESGLDEYLSCVADDNDNLWFVTYLDGVWKYDGTTITHYPVKERNEQIALFSIYKDNHGDLWLGSHENGIYKFNGTTFEKFRF